jgi:decaprenylphospho-beta-D-erythro-pentofuranosid-2-ulose 2-reductase
LKRILIIGATSAIAQHCARLWASEGAKFFLVARTEIRLEPVTRDLVARGASSASHATLDVLDHASHEPTVSRALENLGACDIVLIAHGVLPDERECAANPVAAMRQFNINATSTISLAALAAAHLRKQGHGTLAVISSVAGDRGRPSNFHYGAAKAAVSTYCDGLRASLQGTGVNVVTIKPGMVATPMTAGMPLPKALVASPEKVARDIVRGIARGAATIYTPWWWRWIMLIIRLMPEAIFVRLKL